MKIKRIQIEGKWANIRQYVENLIRDGWTEMIRTGEPTFKVTRVELMREV
jgi:hypothetical protein